MWWCTKNNTCPPARLYKWKITALTNFRITSFNLVMKPNKSGVQLPVITKARAKGKRFYSGAVGPGTMADFHLKDHLLFLPRKKSNRPQQGLDKSQCPQFLLHFRAQSFGARRWLLSSLSPHPGGLACSQLLSMSGSLLKPWAMWP